MIKDLTTIPEGSRGKVASKWQRPSSRFFSRYLSSFDNRRLESSIGNQAYLSCFFLGSERAQRRTRDKVHLFLSRDRLRRVKKSSKKRVRKKEFSPLRFERSGGLVHGSPSLAFGEKKRLVKMREAKNEGDLFFCAKCAWILKKQRRWKPALLASFEARRTLASEARKGQDIV